MIHYSLLAIVYFYNNVNEMVRIKYFKYLKENIVSIFKYTFFELYLIISHCYYFRYGKLMKEISEKWFRNYLIFWIYNFIEMRGEFKFITNISKQLIAIRITSIKKIFCTSHKYFIRMLYRLYRISSFYFFYFHFKTSSVWILN